MLRKLLHIVLLVTLVITPVVNGYSAAMMADVANMPVSEKTDFSSALVSYHSHGGSSIENINSADFDEQSHAHKNMANSHSQSCCLDCDGECAQGCLLGIIQPPTLSLRHTLDTAVSFMSYPRFQTPSDLPKRPPRLS